MKASTTNRISSTQIKDLKSVTVIKWLACEFNSVQPPTSTTIQDLTFIGTEEFLRIAIEKKSKGLIVLDTLVTKIADDLNSTTLSNSVVFSTPSIQWAMSEVLPFFDSHPSKNFAHIHPTAVVSESARLGKNVYIGAYSVVESNCRIGDFTTLESHVYVAANSEIGNNVLIHPFVTIGKPGFGFYTNKEFVHTRIPQIGNVVIEDHCEIGSHCSIDRATLTETRIKQGTKFDNFCHVAHNCEIGENSIITAGFIVAGSTVLGKNLMTAGGVHVNGHIKVADNVILTGRTGVISDIEKPGAYGGFPAIPFKKSLRAMSSIEFLPKIRKQLALISKQLGLDFKEKED